MKTATQLRYVKPIREMRISELRKIVLFFRNEWRWGNLGHLLNRYNSKEEMGSHMDMMFCISRMEFLKRKVRKMNSKVKLK